jgi:hypothetical protein
MIARIAQEYSDTELEQMFNEHLWRKPIQLRYDVNTVGGFQAWTAVGRRFVCPFCLYRKGPGVRRYMSAEDVERHLKIRHPPAGG